MEEAGKVALSGDLEIRRKSAESALWFGGW